MCKFLSTFFIFYIMCNIVSTLKLWRSFHEEENKEKLEKDLERFSADFKLTKEDVLVCFYLVSAFLGFIALPCSFINKLRGKSVK